MERDEFGEVVVEEVDQEYSYSLEQCSSANKKQSLEGPMAGCPGISLGSPCL